MSKAIQVLADVAVTDSEQTITLSNERWFIESVIISNITASTGGELTLKFNDNNHFNAYEVDANKVFPVPFPYVLQNGQTFKYGADAASVFRVALIGTREDLS